MNQAILPLMLAFAMGMGPAPETPQRPIGDSNLSLCEAGLLDPEARQVDRQRWAEMLLGYDSEEARSLLVRLLSLDARLEVQRALAKAVADRARKHPSELHESVVEPLVTLLGSEDGALRAAAAEALAVADGENVTKRLGTLARNNDAPTVQRLAAIDALAPNIHRRIVLDELISAMGEAPREIKTRIATALAPATREPLGDDSAAWRDWWLQTKALSDENRLAEQFWINRLRLGDLRAEFQRFRDDARQRQEAIVLRMREFQLQIARSLDSEQLKESLVQWLGDPVSEVARTGLSIIKARMADDGLRPEALVLEALLELLHRGPPEVRREVLLIVQNVSQPAVLREVLQQLDIEQDLETRLALLRAIGVLNRPEAIASLVAQIQSPSAPAACVREAAMALGTLAVRLEQPPDDDFAAVSALKARYASTQPENLELRAALLTAMAGVGDSSCAAEFLDAVEFDDASVVKPAIYGLQRIGHTTKLPRLRDLTAHPDPLVRLSAIEAVSQLGSGDVDLNCLLARLNPVNEENELAREAAWRAVRGFVASKPFSEQIAIAGRLREIPDREVEYLEWLAASLDPGQAEGQPLHTVLTRASELLMAHGEYGRAVVHLRRIYQMRSASGATDLTESVLAWLDCSLRGFPGTDPAGVLTTVLTAPRDEETVQQVIAAVVLYLDSQTGKIQADSLSALIEAIGKVHLDDEPESWSRFLANLETRVSAPQVPAVQSGDPKTEASSNGH